MQNSDSSTNPVNLATQVEGAAVELSKFTVLLLAAVSALGPVSMQILLPAIPLIRESFVVTEQTAQLTLSLSMLSIAIATLIYGPLSDRYGRKPIMIAGLLITLGGSFFCLVAESIEALIVGRVIQASGGAAGLVLARAIVRDVYPADKAARVIATLVMIMVVMPMMSPIVGGELMVRFGLDAIFLTTILFSAVVLILLLMKLKETHHHPVHFEGLNSMLSTYAKLFQSRRFNGYAFCVTFVSVVFFSFIAAGPEIMVSVFKRPETEYGRYFVSLPLGFMLGNYIARRSSHRDMDKVISLGATISLVGLALAILLQLVMQIFGLQHPAALFAPVALAILGNGITLPNAQAAAINEFPEIAGSASGLTGFLQMAVSAAGAQLVAVIYNGTVYPLLALMFLASVLSLVCFRISQR